MNTQHSKPWLVEAILLKVYKSYWVKKWSLGPLWEFRPHLETHSRINMCISNHVSRYRRFPTSCVLPWKENTGETSALPKAPLQMEGQWEISPTTCPKGCGRDHYKPLTSPGPLVARCKEDTDLNPCYHQIHASTKWKRNLKELPCWLCETLPGLIILPFFSLFIKNKNAFPNKSINFLNSLSTETCSMNSFIYAKTNNSPVERAATPSDLALWEENQKEWDHILIWPTDHLLGSTAILV